MYQFVLGKVYSVKNVQTRIFAAKKGSYDPVVLLSHSRVLFFLKY